MSKPIPKYFEYYCKNYMSALIPVNHNHSPLNIKINWQNYYCSKCNCVVFTDYGFDNK